MKESITKFDLETAFKALDEIEIPTVTKVRANRPALTEIFSHKSKFDALMEEYYDVGSMAELDDAKEAREAEVAQAKLARIEKIVDLDAETPEDLLPSYVGKFIMQCPQCMTLFYKNPEDVEASEEDPNTVNVNEVCQHCGNEAGYTLIGKVGEATEEETAEFTQEETVDVTSTDEEIPEEPAEDSEEDTAEEEAADDDLDFDLDAIDLDLPEDEEEKTEESFNAGSGEQTLVEELNENADLDVSDAEFEELINSSEFQKPITDRAARAMIDEFEESREQSEKEDATELTEDLNEGIFDKLKDKFVDTVDKVASKLKSREAKADWVLQNALEDYNNVKADAQGQLVPDKENRRFNTFIVVGYTNKYTNGKVITMPPSFDNKDLVVGKNGVQEKQQYKDADNIAKGWSISQGNGPAFIYLAKSKDDPKGVFLCEYFQGKIEKDQLEKYFNVVKNHLKGAKLMAKGGMKAEEELADGTLNLDGTSSKDLKFFATEIFNHFNKKYSIDIVDGYKIHVVGVETDLTNEISKADAIVKNKIEVIVEKLADNTYAYKLRPADKQLQDNLDTVMTSMEDLQESTLESLISDSLVESYGNVAGFRLTECDYTDKKFNVNGTIFFSSGNTRKTTYTFTEALSTEGKVSLHGLNEKLGLDKQITMTGRCENKTFITESFKQNKK
jgi:hypothetical protein